MSNIKRYIIEHEFTGEGKGSLTRRNEGFNPWELLGLLEHSQMEILKQLSGEIKPDVIKREVIKDEQ
jgi:hypothetical protein